MENTINFLNTTITMAKLFFSIILLSIIVAPAGFAHELTGNHESYSRAKILEIVEEGTAEVGGFPSPYQIIRVKFLSGEHSGETAVIEYGKTFTLNEEQKLKTGDKVIVNESSPLSGTPLPGDASTNFFIVEKDRIAALLWIGAIFLAAVILIGRAKGIGAVLGLVISVLVLATFIVPKIAAGSNPLLISLSGAFLIAVLSLYPAHGFSKQTTIALGGTLVTLAVAFFFAKIFVAMGSLTGLGAEETFYLQVGDFANLDFRGLLLGGIMIGALGVLDDITTAQTAVIFELHKANPNLSPRELFQRGLVVGREHIASLVNTLALAYVGASLPLLLLFLSNTEIPLWLTFNEEVVAEEIIRTLAGSTALILAVPISTYLAALSFRRRTTHPN